MKFPVLETDRLFLRRPTAADQARALAAYGASGRTLATAPLAGSTAWSGLASFLCHWDLHGHGLFAVIPEGADTPVGLVGPWAPSNWPEPEIGWQIWGDLRQDLLHEAVAAVRSYAAAQLGWYDMISYVRPQDAGSMALARALGALPDPMARVADGATAIVMCHPPATTNLFDRAA